jgi:hypothetical protein
MPARRSMAAALAIALPALLASAAGAASPPASRGERPAVHAARQRIGTVDGPLSPAGRQLLGRGYLVPHPAAYARAKAALSASDAQGPEVAASAAASPPAATRVFNGAFDSRTTPPDSTAAVGPTRFVQLVNTKFAIYRRDGAKLSGGELGTLTGMGDFPFLTDPQIIWDPGTKRFYYVALDFDIAVRNLADGVDFVFGFSKMPSPSDAGDWCKYTVSLGYDDRDAGRRLLGDQPHLGDTADYVLWGVNLFDVRSGPRFTGADVDWVSKPPPGRRCPKAGDITLGARHHLRTAADRLAFTPVVANQADGSHTGWVVAAQNLPRARSRARTLSVFKVTRSPAGAVIQQRARAVPVGPYGFPPPAPQAGTFATLDTLDGRLTQAVAAIDPSRHKVVVWTQHAVRGRAGSIVRWYEIDPGHHRVVQQGEAGDPVLWAFNGAISSDRAVREGVRRYGRSMVLGFDTTSDATDSAVQMVSKVGRAPQSGFVLIRRSGGPARDFSCRDTGTCRWGDFAGASPDPAAKVGARRGRVWLTNMRNVPNRPGIDWRTVNWEARP